jgi:hypothetical protein
MNEAHECGLAISPEKTNDIPIHDNLDPQFTPDVLRLKFCPRGAGIRTSKDPTLFLNSMANIGPQISTPQTQKARPHEESSTG